MVSTPDAFNSILKNEEKEASRGYIICQRLKKKYVDEPGLPTPKPDFFSAWQTRAAAPNTEAEGYT